MNGTDSMPPDATRLTVVVPAFNAERKVGRCIAALDREWRIASGIEVIFVDDLSTDSTAQILEEACRTRANWRVVRRDTNSGSPSQPRNDGLALARGTYVCFMDADDEFLPGALATYLGIAETDGLDLLRGSLLVDRGRGDLIMSNVLPRFDAATDKVDRVRAIMGRTSTTVPGLIRRELLDRHTIRWDPSLRMGEDSVFLVQVLEHAEVIQHEEQPLFVYRNAAEFGTSSTHSYGERELRDHLEVWRRVSDALSHVGISYMEVRGQVALQAALASMVRFHDGSLTEDTFSALSAFLRVHHEVVLGYDYGPRTRDLVAVILDGDFDEFREAVKPRLLVAGQDLKFIEPAMERLAHHFQIKVDQWTGHDAHVPTASKRLAKWADVIHCEWLLGNAVWYARHKSTQQRMLVRAHRFEMTRPFGGQVRHDQVDRFVGVSVPAVEYMLESFPGIPRSKARVVPNFIDVDAYRTSEDPDRVFSLAMVGILPSLKGYRQALQLLHDLRTFDQRYTLTTYGRGPDELRWVRDDPMQAAYYRDCHRFVEDHDLAGVVQHRGWVDTTEALADHGFVLSLSDLESFHVAPAEGFASGNCGVFLPWDGVEHIYPEKYVHQDLVSLRDAILDLRDVDAFDEYRQEGRDLVRREYSLDAFVSRYVDLVREI